MNRKDTIDYLRSCTFPRIAVIGGPGSGKTRVLVERALALLRSDTSNSIIIFTLTRGAAKEISERIKQLDCGEFIGTVKVTTIHAFCYGIIQELHLNLGYTSGPPIIIDDTERDSIVRIVIEELGLSKKVSMRNVGYAIDGRSERIEGDGARELSMRVAREFFSRLLQCGMTTYEQCINSVIDLLNNYKVECTSLSGDGRYEIYFREVLQSRFNHFFIDEAQDIDGIAWKLIDIINPNNVMAVGDARQAIYEFRGGDSSAFLAFANHDRAASTLDLKIPDINCWQSYGDKGMELSTTVYLRENYRSVPGIVEASNAMFPEYPPMHSQYIFKSDSPCVLAINRTNWMGALQDLIGTTAILCRNNRDLDVIEEALREAHVFDYYRVPKKPEITDAVRKARSVWRFISNPSDSNLLRRVLDQCDVTESERTELLLVQSVERNLTKCLTSVEEYLKRTPLEGDEKVEFDDEFNRINEFVSSGGRVEEYLLEAARSDFDYESTVGLVSAEAGNCRMFLSTIHKAKGLEWSNVILFTNGLKNALSDKRLFFVALTRAKNLFTVVPAMEHETIGPDTPEYISSILASYKPQT